MLGHTYLAEPLLKHERGEEAICNEGELSRRWFTIRLQHDGSLDAYGAQGCNHRSWRKGVGNEVPQLANVHEDESEPPASKSDSGNKRSADSDPP